MSSRSPSPTVRIDSLDQEGRGAARLEGKAVFVEGALPGEAVTIATLKRKPTYEVARVESIVEASPSRVEPRCPHFGVCGGCTLQHADLALQVAAKQRVLEEALARIGRVRPETVLPAIYGPGWGYRYRARLSVRNVPKKGGVLVGFHERRSSYVADMRKCFVLPPKIGAMLPSLRALIESLSIRDRVPQIELAVGDRASQAGNEKLAVDRQPMAEEPLDYALVLRILEPPTSEDEGKLRAFGDQHAVQLWLQPGGPASAFAFHPQGASLAYTLPEFGVTLAFSPTEFTQVSAGINRVMVRRAIALLDPRVGERIADFFCGLGNFTLPIARRGATALGVEGSESLVRHARDNARMNGLAERARFEVANLFGTAAERLASWLPLDKALVDPPREGAVELVKVLRRADDQSALRRIVYVSCNPATLARDSAVLVHERGYALRAAGVINMFPHTGHVESIAVFEPGGA